MATGTYARPLGDNQRHVLKALARYGAYSKNGDWVWVSHGTTVTILESLVRRDLVSVDHEVGTWRLTSAGLTALGKMGYDGTSHR